MFRRFILSVATMIVFFVGFGSSPLLGEEKDVPPKFADLMESTERGVADFNAFVVDTVRNVLFCGRRYLSDDKVGRYQSCASAARRLMDTEFELAHDWLRPSRRAYLESLVSTLIETQERMDWGDSEPVETAPPATFRQRRFQECFIDTDANRAFCRSQFEEGMTMLEDCFQGAERARDNCLETILSVRDEDDGDED